MDIRKVQTKLGLSPDNILGPNTFSKIASYAVGREVSFNYWPDQANTPQRLADFIAQTAHETNNYRRFDENLNYSGQAALKTWPRHFNKALADWAHRNPERIAEVAYGVRSRQGHGRMGNTKPGDGWKYRGRGALQLTGKDNYAEYGRILKLDLLNHPELAQDPATSLRIADLYYTKNGVWAAIDAGKTVLARQKVNGGTLGLAQVNDIRAKVLSLFK